VTYPAAIEWPSSSVPSILSCRTLFFRDGCVEAFYCWSFWADFRYCRRLSLAAQQVNPCLVSSDRRENLAVHFNPVHRNIQSKIHWRCCRAWGALDVTERVVGRFNLCACVSPRAPSIGRGRSLSLCLVKLAMDGVRLWLWGLGILGRDAA
jgi:hypothetical protein